ncbi:MAG: DNA mismatch repair protein MutL, partial [Bdellovibrionaceae bacterium]|nr:DNA mismatch repair protein MutL [Pseudobdellovibrionaceae bacterium]
HRCLRSGLEQAPWLEKKPASMSVQAPTQAYQPQVAPEPLAFQEPEFARTQYQKRVSSGPPVTFDVLKAAATAAPAYIGHEESARAEGAAGAAEIETTPPARAREFVRPATVEAVAETRESSSFWSRLHVLGQARLTYILAENENTLYLIDQHAAHERVGYERLMRAWREGRIERQNLLLPLTLDLDVEVAEALAGHARELARIGLELEPMGPDAIAVRAIPAGIQESAIARSLSELGREIVEKGGGFAIERKIGDLCATMACHSVVRAGQALSLEQMQSLLEQMDEFPLSSFCPHGRPVSVEYPFHKLERDFGRIV